ncbi:MAG: hypothetical protein IPG00_16985 [Saprospiraceae bacterium]|nr:hypothetical protein [Saprospiraceae bacterium]
MNISACQGDDKQYMSGGTTFNEENPSGTGYINKANCYNSIELVNITFEPLNIANFIHTGVRCFSEFNVMKASITMAVMVIIILLHSVVLHLMNKILQDKL